jgi:adenine-specific DNA-methyltransferase
VDINKGFIRTCKNNFKNFKFQCTNFINFKTTKRFDYVIGNPPYVKIQNIDKTSIDIMRKEYPEFIYGNTNLYAYFLVKCFDMLNDDGKLIFIMPNTFLYNKSLTNLKKFIFDHRRMEVLIDFKEKQIFNNFMTYTCIIVLTKTVNKVYRYALDIDTKLKTIAYKHQTQQEQQRPSDIHYRIGLMTLCDNVYIIKEFKEVNHHIEFMKEGITYRIEKGSCRNILKVSKRQMYKIIYPYILDENDKVKIDLIFLKKYPKCAKYLQGKMDLLKARDGGDISSYPIWYAYGRTQSLLPYNGKRVFLPTTIKDIRSSVFKANAELYYSGMWIESSKLKNQKLIDILKSNERGILQLSSNKAGGWYGITINSFSEIKY